MPPATGYKHSLTWTLKDLQLGRAEREREIDKQIEKRKREGE